MFKNMKIGKKLMFGFSVMMILIAVMGFIGYRVSDGLSNSLTVISDDLYPKTVFANDIIKQLNISDKLLRDLIAHSSKEHLTQDTIGISATSKIVTPRMDTLLKICKTPEEQKLLNELVPIRKAYRDARVEIIRLALENTPESDTKAWNVLYNEFQANSEQYVAAITNIIKYQDKLMRETGDKSQASAQSSEMMLIIIGICALILGLFIQIFLSKGINNTLKSLRESIEKAINNALNGNLSFRSDVKVVPLEFQPLLTGMNNLINAFVQPINVSAEYIDRISKGDLPPKIDDDYQGDFNEIKVNLNACIDAVALLVEDANMLSKAAVDGKLDTRAKADRHQGNFRAIIKGVNETLDSVIGPLNVAAEYMDRIAKGDIPPRITDNYNGDFNEIKNNLNTCIDAVNALVHDAKMLSDAAVLGKLDTRANADKHEGDFKKIIQGVNNTLDSVIGPLNVAAEYVDRIAKGDIPPRITDNYNGDFNEIKSNLNLLIDSTNEITEAANAIAKGKLDIILTPRSKNDLLVNAFIESISSITALVADVNKLSQAAIVGKLDVRANADLHHGDFKNIIQGVNSTLDAVIGPLNMAAEYVDRIAKGDIPPKITENYAGDFNEIKINLNQCIDNIENIINGVARISSHILEGNLSDRAHEEMFTGDWKVLVHGINEIIEAFIKPIKTTAEYINNISNGNIPQLITEEYHGDFNDTKNNINKCINAVNLLIYDANHLAEGAIRGELSIRADASKHNGDYRKIIEGTNNTLEAIVGPINDVKLVLSKYSINDTSQLLTKQYSGEWIEVAKNANAVGESINSTVSLLENISVGNLSDLNWLKQIGKRSDNDKLIPAAIKIEESLDNVLSGVQDYIKFIQNGELANINFDANKFDGVYKEIFIGLNAAAKANLEPISETLAVMKLMSNSDFTSRINGNYHGDFKDLKDSLNLSLEEINEAFANVLKTARSVESGSHQVADSSTSLSQGATEQAASLEEMTSSMSEVASQTKRNAENANVAKSLATEARNSSDRGEQEMNQLKKAMDEINESSKNIAKIIKVIDEIAFQTNLLALNAAVEAARAGVHGQGFAVVAEEVRNLAARSAQAAKETAEMIEGSIKTVDRGSSLSQKTQEALNEIKMNSTKVNDIITEIAVSSNEQAQGIAQINLGLNQIDKVTQQNTATAEESATSADELSSQSRKLTALISRFRINGGDTQANAYSSQPSLRGASQSRRALSSPSLDEDEFNIDLDI